MIRVSTGLAYKWHGCLWIKEMEDQHQTMFSYQKFWHFEIVSKSTTSTPTYKEICNLHFLWLYDTCVQLRVAHAMHMM